MTAQGAEAVYHRIERTARRTCRHAGKPTLFAMRIVRECRADLTEEIVASIDYPHLNQAHAAAKNEDRFASRRSPPAKARRL